MFIGEYEVDTDTAILSVAVHNSSGVSADADTDIAYSIYNGDDTSVVASGTLSKFNSLTGHYLGKQVISTANGFATGNSYTAFLKAIVSSDTAIALRTFRTKTILDHVLDSDFSLRHMQRIDFAVLSGESAGGGTSTITFKRGDGATNAVSATVTADGNRTAVVRNGT